ncbi:hypothetical protein EIN_429380 [Entamoeba invadens IP1]|uniref:F-box domain-containing protein n=1 Tax=Entamoeba invadens IP1 TaxID=370355 RepID=A0A0A1UHE3_ENTIV|nr:hypothetical protein EIN_429380 [Entamoeba invadens IP1]ELP95172.1 hypothetical protein EIN_429380 [Entamoeba invadens IP1]|eukprot:XP_004261943.1 hypothetical protein EIN_429380 [Entamoeba invadens IP1]
MLIRLEPFYMMNVILYIQPSDIKSFEFVSTKCHTAIEMMHTNPVTTTEVAVTSLLKVFPKLHTLQITSEALLKVTKETLQNINKIQLVDRDFFIAGDFLEKMVFSTHLPLKEDIYPYLRNLTIPSSSLVDFKMNADKYPNLQILKVLFREVREVKKVSQVLLSVITLLRFKVVISMDFVINTINGNVPKSPPITLYYPNKQIKTVKVSPPKDLAVPTAPPPVIPNPKIVYNYCYI